MNLPWDKSYIKFCFYVILIFTGIYVAKNVVDGIIYTFVNLGDIYSFAMEIFKKLCSVFSIIIAGFIIAYILNPLVEIVYNKTRLKNTASVGVVFLMFIIGAAVILSVVLYSVNYNEFSHNIKKYGDNINNMYVNTKGILNRYNLYYIEKVFDNINYLFYNYIKSMCDNVLNISRTFLSRAVTFLLSVVVAFYMLRDKEKILIKLNIYFNVFINKKWRNSIKQILSDVDSVFSGYLRGQLTDGLVMAALISFGLSVIGVPFSVAIGIFSGFSNIIPYFGSIIGFILSVGMALISGEPIKALYAAILVIALQQLDSIFIVPKIVGESVKLSPVMVIISLAVSNKLFGIWGMVFAVPVAAVIKLRLDRYCESKNNMS